MTSIVFGTTALGNLFVELEPSQKQGLMKSWLSESATPPLLIDTAGKYGAGLALEEIARGLSSLRVEPGEVRISNKLGWRRVPLVSPEPTFEPGVWKGLAYDAVQDISYAGILRCWEEGEHLLAPYASQWLSVHDPDEYLAAANSLEDRKQRLTDIVGAYRALSELKRSGKVEMVGIGCKDWTVVQEIHKVCDLDWVMFANSWTIMRHPPELSEFMSFLAQKGIEIINSAVTHGGFLVGGEFLDYRHLDPENSIHQRALEWRTRFHGLCEDFNISPYFASVAFGKAHPGISGLAVSTSRAHRVSEMVAACHANLPKTFWQKLATEKLISQEAAVLCSLI